MVWWLWSLAHGQEFNPVIEEASWVNTGVDDQSPEKAASGFLSQSQTRLSFGHVEADVDKLEEQQVQQTSGHDTAVPGTGETQSRAEEQKTGQLLTYCIINTPNNTNAVVNNRIEAVRNQT